MAEPLQGAWVEVAPQTEPVQGTSDHISVRYSHAGVAWHGSMFVSHGYFYNHKRHRPAWQSDTWRFDLRALKWERVHRAWTGDGDASTPSPRYSTSAVIDAPRGRMLMFGGDDGGHRESPNNYIFGAHFDELWAFDLERHAWSRTYKPPGAAWPAKRALHGAAIANGRMHVYGGLGISDHWAYELESGAWLKVAATSAESASDSAGEGYADAYPTGPGSRHALKLAAGGDGRGIYLFGGSRHGTKGAMRPKVFDDLWYFAETGARGGVLEGVWLRLGGGTARITPPKPGAPPPDTGNLWPGPRGHHSLITLAPESGLDVGVVLFGGAMCSPGCACYNDTWVFVPRERAFHRVQVAEPIIWRYRQSLVYSPEDKAFYTFGGESYRPYMYHNSVSKLTLPTGWIDAQLEAERASPHPPFVPAAAAARSAALSASAPYAAAPALARADSAVAPREGPGAGSAAATGGAPLGMSAAAPAPILRPAQASAMPAVGAATAAGTAGLPWWAFAVFALAAVALCVRCAGSLRSRRRGKAYGRAPTGSADEDV